MRELKLEEDKCKELVEVISGYFLLPNDALHVATMKRYGITNIATNDPDFEWGRMVKCLETLNKNTEKNER